MRKELVAPIAQKEIDLYLDTLRAAGERAESIKTRRYQLIRVFSDLQTRPEEVTGEQLVELFAQKRWKPETRKSHRSCLRCFFEWLYKSGKSDHDPAKALPKVRTAKPEARPCPDRFIIAALREANEEETLMIRLASECGLRRTEISQVSSTDVVDDLVGKTLIVHGKGGRIGYVPLADDLAERIMAADGYVFPGRWGGHVEASYVGKRLTRLLPQGWSGHTLRHRFATTTYEETHDILLVSKALRHENVATTQRYVAFPQERMREVVKAVRIAV